MSENLFNFIDEYIKNPYNCSEFCDQYIDLWKMKRDDGSLASCDERKSEKLSSIFCLVDLYNPEESREEYELDEKRLREGILNILKGV